MTCLKRPAPRRVVVLPLVVSEREVARLTTAVAALIRGIAASDALPFTDPFSGSSQAFSHSVARAPSHRPSSVVDLASLSLHQRTVNRPSPKVTPSHCRSATICHLSCCLNSEAFPISVPFVGFQYTTAALRNIKRYVQEKIKRSKDTNLPTLHRPLALCACSVGA